MSPWEKLLERPQARGHFVQLYQADELALASNVGHYLAEGIKRGDGALVIVTPEHRELFGGQLDRLGIGTQRAIECRQLVFLDAHDTLAEFMEGGEPDWNSFEAVVRSAMRQVLTTRPGAGLRAYGEMVGVLWKARQFAAAIRLEQLWNRLLEQSSFCLYCAYAIDVFGKEFHVANLDGVLCTHTHLVPAQPNGALETALNLALDDIFHEKADDLRVLIKANHRPSWAIMPTAENMLLWLRRNLSTQADSIVERAQHHYLNLKSVEATLAGSKP